MNGRSLAVVIAVCIAGSADARPVSAAAGDGTSKVVPVGKLRFYTKRQGLNVADAWGDPASGPHSNFIKMPAGAKSGLHTHSFSYYGVVVSGTLANEASDAAVQRPLPPGSYWFQKSGEPHVTNCLSRTACLIFVTSPGAFDFHKIANDPRRPAATRGLR